MFYGNKFTILGNPDHRAAASQNLPFKISTLTRKTAKQHGVVLFSHLPHAAAHSICRLDTA
jgi:hypothetical protein